MTALDRRRFLAGASSVAAASLLASQGALSGSSASSPNSLSCCEPDGAEEQVKLNKKLVHAQDVTPKHGGILRTAYGAVTNHFDIHQGGDVGTLCQMYDLLVMPNPEDGFATIVPNLAESWDISEDGLTYTFELRDGVTFHDGTPFSAEDVVATFQRIAFPPEGMASVFQGFMEEVDTIEQVGPLSMRFVLKRPWAPFLGVLSAPQMVVYSKKSLEENNYDLRTVIAPGTGLFVHEDYLQGEKWTFTRNPNYYNPELPYVDGLEMLHVPAWTDRGTAILTDQADLSWNVSVDTFEEGENRPDEVSTRRIPHIGAPYAVVLNNTKEPFNDPRVRRAIHLAVSRQNLISAFRLQETLAVDRWLFAANDFSMPVEEIVTLPGYREDKTEDIETAKALLAEAGFPDGFGDIELMTASTPPHAEIMAPAIQDELKRTLNIETTIRPLERTTLNDYLARGEYDIQFATLLGSPSTDPTPMWNSLWKTGASQNWSGYSNAEFDAILDQINIETDDEVRQSLFYQGMDILDQDSPVYYIGYCCYQAMWRSNVRGIMENWEHTQWGRIQTAWLDD